MKRPEIPLTEKEIQAIRNYSGYKHARINMIADMQPEKYKRVNKNRDLNITAEQLEELIEEFINIYAAIYKKGNVEESTRLYRGTSQDEARRIGQEEELKTFLSTTVEESIAKTFCEYSNAAIIRIKTKQGLSHLYIEPYKEEGKRNEKECVILPFSEVVEAEHTSNWNGYSYYDVIIQKGELPEVKTEELENLKTQCIEEFDDFQEQIIQYNSLVEEIEGLNARIRIAEREELRYIYISKDEKTKQAYSISDKMKEYRKNFTMMLKGACRQKEKDIDKQREEILEQERKEKEREETERLKELKKEVEKLKTQLPHKSENLRHMLDFNRNQLENNANLYQKTAKAVGVSYTQYPPDSLLKTIENIKLELEQEEEHQPKMEIEEEYKYLLREKIKLKKIENDLRIFPNMISNHKKQSMQEIRFNLNCQVRGIIAKVKYRQLQQEKNELLKEKDSIFQKITGRNRIKEEQLRNIEARMKLVVNDMHTMNPENKVRGMLESMYECSYESLNGQFTPEMVDMINKIRRNFGGLPNEQELQKKAIENLTNGYPVPIQQKQPLFFRKRKILQIQNQTKMVEEKSRKVMARKRRTPPVEMDVIAEMKNKMNYIYDKIKEGDYEQEELEIETIGELKGNIIFQDNR